jgi:hypothetical protein
MSRPLDHRPRRTRLPFTLGLLFAGAIAFWLLVGAWIIGAPRRGFFSVYPDWSAGKYEESPDQRFRAEGLVYCNNGHYWCTMEVVEIASSKRVFFLKQTIGPYDKQPMFDQGNSLDDGIEWAPDSTSVTFLGKNRQAFVVPVH